jgi:hypothetical protein
MNGQMNWRDFSKEVQIVNKYMKTSKSSEKHIEGAPHPSRKGYH